MNLIKSILKNDALNKELLFNILLTILFAIITFNSVLHHEIWADEAQVWLLVKNLSVPELLKHLVNEGHPSFFYLLVMPFAKLNFSILAMQTISWLGTVLGAFMVLQFSPFNKFTKFSIITSAGFLYFFPVIARNYSILPFLVTLAAYLYAKNKEKPVLYAIVLALIANTHVIMFGFVFALACIFLYDNVIKQWKELEPEKKKENLISFSIIVLGLFALIMQLYGTFGSNSAIVFSFERLTFNISYVLRQFFLNMVDYTVVRTHAIYGMTLYGSILLAALTIFSLVALFITNKRAFWAASCGIFFQFVIYILSYRSYIYPTRIACAYLILLFCFWITIINPDFEGKFKFLNKKFLNIILALMFFLTFLNGVRFTLMDLMNNYSCAKVTASFIEKNIPQNARIITTNDPFSLGLYYYLPQNRLWSIMQRKYIKYVVWDETLELTFVEKDWSRIVRGKFIDEYKTRPIYIVQPSFFKYSNYEIFPQKDFELIYQSGFSIADGEGFRIYKFIGH